MLVAGAWLLRRDRRKEERRDDRYTGIYYFKVTAIAVLVCWLLLLRVGDMSLWRLVFELVPGGKALRAISRFQVFLSFPIGIVCGAYMEELSAAADKTESKKKGIVLHLAMVAFILFLYAENSLKNGCPAYWNRGEQLAYLESVPQPPEECRTFCIYEDAEVSPERTDVYNYQLDAWMIALKYDKKTVNGYSGNFPPDWGGLWQVNSPWYMNWVSDWVVQKQIPVDGFYVYDTTWQRWEPFLEFAPLAY